MTNECPPKELMIIINGRVCCKGCTLIGCELAVNDDHRYFACGYMDEYNRQTSKAIK